MNFFQCTGDFYSFAACSPQPYRFRDEMIRNPDTAENFESPGGIRMNALKKPGRIERVLRPTALLASLFAAAPLAAEETDPAYTMTVIIDAAHGNKVAAGKYERAIEKIIARKSTRDSYSQQTNLCVAYTKTGELDKATEACQGALAITLDGKVDRVYRAVALSNLGVLHAAKGSQDIARRTFLEALDLNSGLSAPKTNLARVARGKSPSA